MRVGGCFDAPDVVASARVVIPANVRSALLLAIGVLLLGGVAALAIHDDPASTTRAASSSTTIAGSSGTTGPTGDTSTSSSPTTGGGAGGASSTSTTVAPGSFLGGGSGTEMQRGTEDDQLAYTGWGSPLATVLVLLALAGGTRAAAAAMRPH